MKFAIDPEARSFEDICLHAQILCDDLSTLEATLADEPFTDPVRLLAACLSRSAAQLAELAQRLALREAQMCPPDWTSRPTNKKETP